MVEIVVSAAILGGVAVFALQGIRTIHDSQMDTADMSHADLLARDLMSEILAQDYSSSGVPPVSSSVSNRSSFDSIDDYNQWNSDGSRSPQRKDGTLLTLGEGWTRRVVVEYVDPDDFSQTKPADTGVHRIEVTVARFGKDLASFMTTRTSHWRSAPTID